MIQKKDVPYIAIGAKMLSCGGGGDPKTIEYIIRSVMDETEGILVKTIDELSEDWIVPVGIAGSPILFSEDPPGLDAPASVLSAYGEIACRKAEAVISFEIGGVNALTPLLFALRTGLPVVDGDGMGRAFPELHMTTYALHGIPIQPMAAQSGETLLQIGERVLQEQAICRLKEMWLQHSGYVLLACYGGRGSSIRPAIIPGTLKLALQLGRATESGSYSERLNTIGQVFTNSMYGSPSYIALGYVSKVARWFERGSLVGSCHISGKDAYGGKSVQISFQNEFLSLHSDGEAIVGSPDLILLLDYYSLLPKLASELQEGDMVHVLTVPAPSVLRTKGMLRLLEQQSPVPNSPSSRNKGKEMNAG